MLVYPGITYFLQTNPMLVYHDDNRRWSRQGLEDEGPDRHSGGSECPHACRLQIYRTDSWYAWEFIPGGSEGQDRQLVRLGASLPGGSEGLLAFRLRGDETDSWHAWEFFPGGSEGQDRQLVHLGVPPPSGSEGLRDPRLGGLYFV